MTKCIGKANLTYDELCTEVTNVEAVLNSIPLTYIYPDDLAEPLTPSHLLNGRRLLNLPELPEIDSDEDYNEKADSVRNGKGTCIVCSNIGSDGRKNIL